MKKIIILMATPILFIGCHLLKQNQKTITIDLPEIVIIETITKPTSIDDAIKHYSKVYNIPEEIIVAQLLLESNYFNSKVGKKYNNGFGHRKYCRKTKKYIYISYRNSIECIESHCKLLSTRYWPITLPDKKRVLNPSLEDWVDALDGYNVTGRIYAEDSQYRKKLRSLLKPVTK